MTSITDVEIKPKKTLTTLDVMAWISEVKNNIVGTRINNFYSIEDRIFLLKLYGAPKRFLLIEPGRRVHFTEYKYPIPEKPSILTLSLRKYLKGQKIKEIRQVGFDRIIIIELLNNFKLIIELIPRGFLVLVDEENNIIHANRYEELRDRTIRRGIKYVFPPYFETMPNPTYCQSLQHDFWEKKATKLMGLPKEVVEEAIYRDKNDPCKALFSILDEAIQGKGYITFLGETPIGVYPYRPEHIENPRISIIQYSSFDNAVMEYFSFYDKDFFEVQKIQEDHISKMEKTIQQTREKLESYLEKARSLTEIGMMMLNNRSYLQGIVECVRKVRENEGWERVKQRCKGVIEVYSKKGKVLVEVEGKRLELDIRKEVKDQINEIFEEAKKLKSKHKKGLEKLHEIIHKIEEEKKKKEEEKRKLVISFRKKQWYEKYRWTITRNGILVIAGKDASQNESIVRKILKEHHVFLHADIQGAPATVMLVDVDTRFDETDLLDAAVIAASYSKAWKEGLHAIDVFWVKGDQVSKTPPPGEYLPKGSFMIYGKKNYITNVKLELYLGVEKTAEKEYRIIVGSKEAVLKRGQIIGFLVPGETPVGDVAKKIKKRIEKKIGLIYKDVNEILSLIPGPSKFY